MIDLGLDKADQRLYEAALKKSRAMRLNVTLLNNNEEPVGSLTAPDSWVIGGQVDVDSTRDVTRQLDLTILDPKRKLVLQADSPGERTVFADTFAYVEREDWVEELGGYVACPVFCGPVSRFARNYPLVTIEALGKESLALAPYLLLTGHIVPKGTKVAEGIKRVLGAVGETKFLMPSNTRKLTTTMTIPRWSEPWHVAKRLANQTTGDLYLFYDGRGRVRLASRARQAVWTFTYGEDGTLMDAPDVTYDFTSFRNYVDVTGGIPKKGKKKAHAVASLPPNNPLSPAAMKRNGVNRYAVDVVDDSQILRTTRAQEIANNRLRDLAEVGITAEFDALPIPHLEERDWVLVEGPEGASMIQMKQFSIPLTADIMPVGHNRVLTWKTRIRRHKGSQPWPRRWRPRKKPK